MDLEEEERDNTSWHMELATLNTSIPRSQVLITPHVDVPCALHFQGWGGGKKSVPR